ncbi:TIGR02594 family protein [Pseudoxanthobacter sp.]|uniref:TIGR02594 family protein n=1 Tax=Pseudoxanthobacter sp. TaxID=1925742 RepID=UPI002FDF55C2
MSEIGKLPLHYAWLARETGPRMLLEALKLYGTTENTGTGSNPAILEWAREIGQDANYQDDAIPWCGLFVGVVVHRAGWPVVNEPLWARNWACWGNPSGRPMLGDVLVFRRGQGGHVGLYVGENKDSYFVLGGNQNDAVNIVTKERELLIAARRAPWRIGQPSGVRVIVIPEEGEPVASEE